MMQIMMRTKIQTQRQKIRLKIEKNCQTIKIILQKMAPKYTKDPLKPVTGTQKKLVFGFGLSSKKKQNPNPRPRPIISIFLGLKN